MTSPGLEWMIVADAGPLIGLAKIDRLGLLDAMAEQVVVPAQVWHEVVVRGGDRPEVGRIANALANKVLAPDMALFEAYRLQIDAGEAAALAIAAMNPNALLLMDDARGRRLARAQGFSILGTLGLLLRAKRRGLLTRLGPEIEALEKCGIYLDKVLIGLVLAAAEES